MSTYIPITNKTRLAHWVHPELAEQVAAGNGRVIFQVRPYSTAELCDMYNISRKTFGKWVHQVSDKLGPKIGRYFNVKQVEIFLVHYGIPYSASDD